MKKVIALIALLFSLIAVFAQQYDMETDIFGNLDYTSRDAKYNATLEKNIFDDLVFSDSRNNEVKYEKKYLDKQYPGIHQNKQMKINLFSDLLWQNRKSRGYKAEYQIDIFGKLIIEDNEGYKLEEGKDIFGHNNVEEEINGVKTSIKRNIHGEVEFTSGTDRATLKKDIFDKWVYEDSLGNKFQFGSHTWDRLIRRFRTDEKILLSLVDQYFF